MQRQLQFGPLPKRRSRDAIARRRGHRLIVAGAVGAGLQRRGKINVLGFEARCCRIGDVGRQQAHSLRAQFQCLAMNADKLEDGERCASTSNRNFEGRQGRGGRTHLLSPAMAVAAAVTGHLADIREFK